MTGPTNLLACVLLCAFSFLQGQIEVDVARDFPGIVEVFDSDFRKFYDYERFNAYHRKRVSPAELVRLQGEWEAERKKGDAERARIEGNPEESYLFRLDLKLKRFEYFRGLTFERVDDYRPFYLFVEKTKKPGFASFHRTVADFYGPWLKELLRLYEELYAKPLGLERRQEHGGFALLVLTDRKAYDGYYARLGLGYAPYVRAHYDPELQLGVTYEEPGSLAVSATERRIPALHEMVHAFEFAYGPGRKEALDVTWFAEGFADYLAHHEGQDPAALGQRPIDGQALREFVDWASDSRKASAVFPFEELTGLRGYEQAVRCAWGRAQQLKLDPPQPAETLALLYSSAYLWMHFLHHGENGRYRDGIRSYIGAAITGKLAGTSLTDFFPGTSLAELDAAFLRYVASEWRKSESALAAPELPALKRVDLPAGAPVRSVSTSSEAPPLMVDPELELAAALGEAQAGRLEASAVRLRPLSVRSDASALRERVSRELARLEAVIEVRRRFFDELSLRKDTKLRLPRQDRDWFSFVEAVEGNVVRLAKNNAGETELRLEELTPSYLARELADEKRYGFRAGWARAYLELLAGGEGWRKTLERSTEPEARALLADAEADLTERLGLAPCALALVDISARGEGATPAESQAVFEAIAKLLREQGSVPLVQSRRAALLGRATAALVRVYEARDPGQRLHGRLEDLGEGRVRLSYGFDAEAELEDFQLESLDDEGKLPEGLVLTEARLEKSALVALGFCRLWNHVQLAAPIELSYEFTEKYHEIEVEGMRAQIPPYISVCLLARARDDYIAIRELNGIEDVEQGRQLKRPTRIEEARVGKKFKLEVTADAKGRVSVTVNGQAGPQAGCRPERSGALFLETVGRIELHSLTITGRRTADSFAHWREAWIAEQLAAAGLK